MSIVRTPASVTLTNQTMKPLLVSPYQNHLRALGQIACRSGSHHRTLGTSRFFNWNDASTSEYQKITLREGQGLTFNPTNANYNVELMFAFWVRVVATGACHIVSVPVSCNQRPPLAILNGSGSGIVLEVFNIEVYEYGTDLLPLITLEGIDGADIQAVGEVITPVSFDSANSLNANIKTYKNARVKTQGATSGAFIAITQRLRHIGFTYLNGVGVGTALRQQKGNVIFQSKHDDTDLILQEGRGIAIMQRNSGKASHQEVTIVFLEEDSGAGVFPVEGDVDLGVEYGPTGADYTGTLVQPDEADVASGVQYGADGVEFTGTLSGGGGNIFINID